MLVDSNGFDGIVDSDPEPVELIANAVRAGRLELVITHIQTEEVAATPAAGRREKLLGDVPPTTQVSTAGAIWDVSRFDEATFAGPAEVETIATVAGSSGRHHNDALILSTARSNGWPLLSNDRRLVAVAERLGVRHLWIPELLNKLREMA